MNGRLGDIPEPASAPPISNSHGQIYGFPDSGSDRTRTMPFATTQSVAEAGLIPVEGAVFQEPGAVSGYYGPQGNGGVSQRPRASSRSQSEDTRWGSKNVARPVHTYESHQQPLSTESRGEIVNSYEEERPNGYSAYGRGPPNQRSPPAEDEMPNFEALPSNMGRGQPTTIDSHLQPLNSIGTRRPPVALREDYQRGNPPPDQYYPEEIPRSRSQPDFFEPPRPGSRQAGGAHPPGMRLAPFDRPATSASSREYGQQRNRDPYNLPNRSRGPGGSRPPGPNGPMPGGDFGPGGGRGGPPGRDDEYYADRQQAPPGQYGRPPNHPRQPPGPWRAPPPNSRGPSDERVPRPDRLRSPPTHNGRPPPNHPDRMQPPGQRRSPPAPGPNAPSGRMQQADNQPSGSRHKGPTLSLDKPLPNPDALPQHPAPVRPGLNGPQASAPNIRPPPVRQYNSASSDPVQQSTSPSVKGGRGPNQVTNQELEHLRQKTLNNPNDSATQFLLAQRLAEAADVLVDERADPATKKRNRDRYQSDALKIIKRLSALSYGEADFFYADCYSRGGLGLQPDIKEAFLLYQKAAKANHAQAAYRVAVCCELGQEDGGGTKRDAVKAMQWYRRAATLGDTAAKYKMGVILLKGLLGQPRNPQEGISWLKQAAEQADKENPHALHELVSSPTLW